ncbi:MAG: hypothetical protein ACFFFG_10480 [Candidatus Thorarchaeota archaeon]
MNQISNQTGAMKSIVLGFILIFNLIGIYMGVELAGVPFSQQTSFTIDKQTQYGYIRKYPALYELLVMANASNTEIINCTAWVGVSDVPLTQAFQLGPGDNFSTSKSLNYFWYSISFFFKNTSEPQRVDIRMEGHSGTFEELLASPGTFYGAGGIFYLVQYIIPALISIVILGPIHFINAMYKFTESKQEVARYLSQNFLPPFISLILFWITGFGILLLAVGYYFGVLVITRIIETVQPLKSTVMATGGVTFLVTAFILDRLYQPLTPQIFNEQVIWGFFPIYPLIITITVSGMLLLFVGLPRGQNRSHKTRLHED